MLSRFAASFLAATIALTGAAGAVEVKQTIEVKGEPGKVWSQIGGWCAIGDWHPVIAKCEEKQDGGKLMRTLTTKDGGAIKETQTAKTAASYSYRIDESPLPVADYTATLAVVPGASAGTTSVVWSAKFEPKGAEAEAVKTMEGVFKAGLDQIKKKLD